MSSSNIRLEVYKEQEPKNRKEKRDLLHRQGWYYHIQLLYGNSWICYKVTADGHREEIDKGSNHNTSGR